MGTYTRTIVEAFDGNEWTISSEQRFAVAPSYVDYFGEYVDGPFMTQNYNVFAFIAGVRNRHGVKPIVDPRGLPEDRITEIEVGFGGYEEPVSRYPHDIETGHSTTFLTAKELLEFDYDQVVVETGETYREFLGEQYFRDLSVLRSFEFPENVRIVFGFDD